MLTTIIIVSLALAWLLYETDYMRVQLPANETVEEYDRKVLAEMELEKQVEDVAYQAWLDERNAPKYRYGTMPELAYVDNPQDKWLSIEDDLTIRRNGEAIYQRGI